MAEALFHIAFRAVDDLLKLGTVSVSISVGGLAAFAAGELIDRHASLAAFDIPQRLIDPADGIVQHGAVLPIRAVVAGLPDVLDAIGSFIQQKGSQIFLDRRLHQIGALRKCGATVAVESVLVGGDLHHRQTHALGLAFDDADVLDARCGHSASGTGSLFLGAKGKCGSAEHTGGSDGFQKIAAMYGHEGPRMSVKLQILPEIRVRHQAGRAAFILRQRKTRTSG